MFEAPEVVATGDAANATARLLWSLGPRFAPLCGDVCAWLWERDVALDAAWCAADNATCTLPVDVCASLANLSAPLAPRTRCLPRAPTLDRDDVIRATMLAVLAVVSTVGNCVTIRSIRTKAVSAANLAWRSRSADQESTKLGELRDDNEVGWAPSPSHYSENVFS